MSRIGSVTNVVTTIKTVRVKKNTSECFDGEITEEIPARNKLCNLAKNLVKKPLAVVNKFGL